MSGAYKLGQKHNRLGHSIHYNPYRNKGTSYQFSEWVLGYSDTNP